MRCEQAQKSSMMDNPTYSNVSSYSVAATLPVVDEEDITYKVLLPDGEVLEIKRGKTSFAEELSFATARLRKISPLASHLFALRDNDGRFAEPGKMVSPDSILHFRMRFFCDIAMLSKECPIAAEHLFLQCRCDFVNGAIRDFQDDADDMAKAKGLAVINMLYDMRRLDISAEDAIKNLKAGQYLPRDLFKRSLVGNMAQRVKNTLLKNMSTKHMLDTLQERDKMCDGIVASQLQEQYVEFLLQCAPSYTSEKFRCRMGINPNLVLEVIRICPYESGVVVERLESTGRETWKEWLKLSDVCDISLRSEKCAAQLNRLSGSPVIVRCEYLEEMESLVALLDGYNRLTRRFYFNLCCYMTNPSLRQLKEEKCHGPMEKELMWEKKLKNKGDGVFTICQSMSQYDAYRIDYVEGGILRSLYIESDEGPHNYRLHDSKRSFSSLNNLVNYYTNGEESKRSNTLSSSKLKIPPSPLSRSSSDPCAASKVLRTCIRPSESDKMGLKLFAIFQQSAYNNVLPHNGSSKELSAYEEGCSTPVCIAPSSVHYASKYEPLAGEQTVVRRAQLSLDGQTYKLPVAVKSLKEAAVLSNPELTSKFLQTMQNFMFIQNSVMTARCFGLILAPLSIVMEYFPHGNFKSFLKQNRRRMTLRLLVDAATQVAKALWWLEESHFVYQQVKCKNIFVAEYGESASVKIRLGPVSLSSSIHWSGPSPPTHYNYIGSTNNGLINGQDGHQQAASELAHFSVWSYGTLLWEIFTLGNEPLPGISSMEAENLYKTGFRLDKPKLCPDTVYWVMQSCWSDEPEKRPKLAELLRQMNQLSAKSYDDNTFLAVTDSNESLTALRVTGNCLRHDLMRNGESSAAYDPWAIDETSLKIMERLGEGRYGEVNKALYTDPLSEDVPRVVAVKQLKQIKCESRNLAAIMDEMRNEMEIMKSLVHPNIVETVGVCVDPVPLLVMEFVENGALNAYLRHHQYSLETFQLIAFARDVASGMVYLHSKDIVHRDLAARNILVSDDLRVKISDFGLARFLEVPGGYYMTQHFGRDVPLAWYAPEVIEFHKYSSKSDIWSFGVLVWEMFSTAAPYFCDLRVLAERLRQGQRLPQPAACPPSLYAVMQRCWTFEAANRPDFKELLDDLTALFEQTSHASVHSTQ